MTEQKTAKLDIPVKPSTKSALQELAKRDDVPLTHIVRKAIKEMLAKEKVNDLAKTL